MIDDAIAAARELGSDAADTEHLLVGLLRSGGRAASFLADWGIDTERVVESLGRDPIRHDISAEPEPGVWTTTARRKGAGMSKESRRLAGILLIIMPTVIYGGVSLLYLLTTDPQYSANELRQDLWRAGHAHAGVLLVLSLLVLRYVDEAALSQGWKWVVRYSVPLAAILLPVAYFFSVLSPTATEPSSFIYLAYVGAVVLALGLVVLGVGLLRG